MKKIVKNLALAALLVATTSAFAQTKLTLGHNAAVGNPKHEAAVKFAELVKEKSGGRFIVQVAPAAQLGDDVPILTSLRSGTVDFAANSQGSMSTVMDGPAGDQLAKLTQDKGMVVLGYWDNGIRHVSNKVRPINTPADMKGLKIRTPPDAVTIDIMKALGAEPEQIKFSELYVALQQGVVDGQENPLMNIWSSKLYEVQKYISQTAHKYEMTPFVMSKRSYDKMSEADRKMIREAALEATKVNRQMSLDSDAKLVGELKAKGIEINSPDLAPFIEATKPVIEKWTSGPQGPYVKQVVDAARAASAK